MAAITIIGTIEKMRFLPDSILVFLTEYKKGYKRKDGVIVDDKYLAWKTIWKPYFKTYINGHFNDGMVVEVKGEILPYAVEHGEISDGVSVLGQTINLFSLPKINARREQKAIKESQMHADETPDLDAYNQPDF